MAAKICTIEVITKDLSRFIALPNWKSPLDSPVVDNRVHGFFFKSKRDAKLFARLLKKHGKECDFRFKIDIDDLPF